jgi:NADH dehydrogenase FAD-containing subunit
VRTGVRVVAADAGGYVLDGGERVAAGLKVWAAGIRARRAASARAGWKWSDKLKNKDAEIKQRRTANERMTGAR